MNSYTLAADSRRWWWLPATAGALGTAAATAILVAPTTAATTPVEPPPSGVVGSVTVVERPCYLARHDWNTVKGWEQPVCTTEVGRPAERAVPGVPRPGADFLP